MTKLRTHCIVLAFCAAIISASCAQTFSTLANFNGANGAEPREGALVQAINGYFYGTTGSGGTSSEGTVFKITADGTLTTLHSFDRSDGGNPTTGLVQGTDGNFYGTTEGGGINDSGTVFKITAMGALTTLHTFSGPDGINPIAGLIQAVDGDFYGTTFRGGASSRCTTGCGTVFKITPEGALTTLQSFDSTDGSQPYGRLVQAKNGLLYGTTSSGGDSRNCSGGCGTVFKITPHGALTTLHSFSKTDGAFPFAGLIQAVDGDLYGTTGSGGAGRLGTVFKITPAGTLFKTLHNFAWVGRPLGTLLQGTDGNFYGTTTAGGINDGTIFQITPGGAFDTLHSFDLTDGSQPYGSLIQATNGIFYGTTQAGGGNGDGTVYSLSVGLGPFVETQPISGRVGAGVRILGNNLTGATSVTFNDTTASFKVVADSEITAIVPTGATTGTVEVTTPSGKLQSNVAFRVTP